MIKELKKLLAFFSPSRVASLLNSRHTHDKPLTEEDYKRIIREQTFGIDTTNELGRRKAYIKCIDYAKKSTLDILDINPFIAAAAEEFKQTRVMTGAMEENIEPTGKERIYLTHSNEYGPEFVGNKEGLLYMARVFLNLSRSKMEGEHVHLYDNEAPLSEGSYPFTVYYEDNKWFDEYAEDEDGEDGLSGPEPRQRGIRAEDIAAFMLLDEAPPTMLVTANKIYKVSACKEVTDENIKVIAGAGEAERAFAVTFVQDDGKSGKILLGANDDGVVFFRKKDLEQIS
ncbi:MAG: hypothetical protein OEV59_05565 [Deltaproteobacteria bacterium]|nr:hypothetical protein [Deltaproteobacteria bacterium]